MTIGEFFGFINNSLIILFIIVIILIFVYEYQSNKTDKI